MLFARQIHTWAWGVICKSIRKTTTKFRKNWQCTLLDPTTVNFCVINCIWFWPRLLQSGPRIFRLQWNVRNVIVQSEPTKRRLTLIAGRLVAQRGARGFRVGIWQNRERHAGDSFYKSSPFKRLQSIILTFIFFFSLISNSPTHCSYQNRSSFSVGCFWYLLPADVPFFSHNFNNTNVIIPPMITALNIAPFKNSSEGNILLLCPEQAQIRAHTVKGICS